MLIQIKSNKNVAIIMGLTASLLFSTTFILNRSITLDGGSWTWSASLRFYWMLPFFVAIVAYKNGLGELFTEIRQNLAQWLIWSTVGFGLFYAPLTFAAAYTPSWLLASTWQFTIIGGIILSPLITPSANRDKKGHIRSFFFSAIIIAGILIMQARYVQQLSASDLLKGIVPVLIAAFAYPLGNRKMMQMTNGRLNVYQRVLGMIICSMPFWLLLNVYELSTTQALPSNQQYFQTFIVALLSGAGATVLFFAATGKVRNNEKQLAAVEATQATEVLFTLAGEIVLLGAALPDVYGIAGIILVMFGMVLHSLKG